MPSISEDLKFGSVCRFAGPVAIVPGTLPGHFRAVTERSGSERVDGEMVPILEDAADVAARAREWMAALAYRRRARRIDKRRGNPQ